MPYPVPNPTAKYEDRVKHLHALKRKNFSDLTPDDRKTLEEFIDDFEFQANLRYLYHGTSFLTHPQLIASEFLASTSYWLTSMVITYPEFVKNFICFTVLSSVANLLGNMRNERKFPLQLVDMKEIYNWIFKGSEDTYNGQDNSQVLQDPLVQRLISLLAPFVTPEFMIVWQKIQPDAQPGMFSRMYNSAASSISARFFNPAPEDPLQKLKISIEQGVEYSNFDGLCSFAAYTLTPKFWQYIGGEARDLLQEMLRMVNGIASLVTTTAEVVAKIQPKS